MKAAKKKAVRSTKKKRTTRKSFSFRLVLSGASELTDELEGAVLGVGCDDALLGIQEGVLFLDFDREAPSFRVALQSAIAAVERAGVGLELIRVEPI